MWLASVHEQLGRYDIALEVLNQADAAGSGAAPFSGARARVLARAGRTAEARQLLAGLPPHSPARAEVLAALGDSDVAFTSLFRALDERQSWLLSDPQRTMQRSAPHRHYSCDPTSTEVRTCLPH